MDNVIEVTQLKLVTKERRRKGILGVVWPRTTEHNEISDLNLQVKSAELLAIVGPNNSGKSKLLEIIAGVTKPTKGTLKILGQIPDARRPAFHSQVQLISAKHPLLWPELSVREILPIIRERFQIPSQELNDSANEIASALSITDLLKVQTRKLNELNRLRSEIFLALITRPQILLLDEIFDDLEPTSIAKLQEMIKWVQYHWQLTIIVTSQQPSKLEGFCDKIAVMSEGQIIYESGLEELMSKYVPQVYMKLVLNGIVDDAELGRYGQIIKREGMKAVMLIERNQAKKIIAEVYQDQPVKNMITAEPDITEIVDRIRKDLG